MLLIYIAVTIVKVESIDCSFNKLSKTGKISGKEHIASYLETKSEIYTLIEQLSRIKPPFVYMDNFFAFGTATLHRLSDNFRLY